jgi:hypothetical protein
MSVLGKILAFLNILGVGGFMVLAGMSYAKRKSWEYANFRADLLVDGLPIDDQDSDKAGVPLVNKFGAATQWDSDRTLKELFPSNPLKSPTQVAEVERVYDLLKKQVDAAEGDRKKNILLAQILMPLAGRHEHPEIYVDREFYLSMKAQLDDDKQYEAFKKALADAFPIAVAAVRFDPNNLGFEKAFQDALRDLPGEDKWKMAEVFLAKLPRSGATFQKAAAAAKQAAEDVETKAKAKEEAEEALEKAKAAFFGATAQAKANPIPANVLLANNLQQAMVAAQGNATRAAEAASLLPDPRDAAALKFLQTIRGDNNKTKVPEFVEETLVETLEAIKVDFTDRFEKVYQNARKGEAIVPDTDLKLIRDRRRQAIARVLLGAIEILDNEAFKKWHGEDGKSKIESMMDELSYKRFVAIVGVDSAVQAINDQREPFVEAVADLSAGISAERASFRNRHSDAIEALKRRADEIERLAQRLDEIGKQASEQVKRANEEEARVNVYVEDLRKSRGDTALEMTELQKIANGLNKVRVAIRDAIRNNESNLRKIADLEYEVLYWQGKMAEKEKADKDKKRKKMAP